MSTNKPKDGGLFIQLAVVIGFILAQWPVYADPAKTELSNPATRAKEMALVKEIHKKIVANSAEATEADMKKYRVDLPGLGQPDPRVPARPFFMLPIKGGTFTMGTRDPNGNPQERPAHSVTLDPFWMQQCEPKNPELADAVALPSHPHTEMAFGMEQDGLPAIGMSQHAANNIANGSVPGPVTSIACPRKRNGNTPVAPAQTPPIPSAIIRPISANTDGSRTTATNGRKRWV